MEPCELCGFNAWLLSAIKRNGEWLYICKDCAEKSNEDEDMMFQAEHQIDLVEGR